MGSLLELNVAMPMMADALLDSIGCCRPRLTCWWIVVDGLEPNVPEIERHLERAS